MSLSEFVARWFPNRTKAPTVEPSGFVHRGTTETPLIVGQEIRLAHGGNIKAILHIKFPTEVTVTLPPNTHGHQWKIDADTQQGDCTIRGFREGVRTFDAIHFNNDGTELKVGEESVIYNSR